MGADKKPKTKQQEYEDLGRIVASVYETGYLDIKKSYKMSFIKGLLSGLGGVIGATIVVALLLWILAQFQNVPLIGPLVKNVQQTVDSNEK